MSVIRANQQALTRVLPHQGNRRYAVPHRTLPLNQLSEGDSWTNNGGSPDYIDYQTYNLSNVQVQAISGRYYSFGASSVVTLLPADLITYSDSDAVIFCTTGTNDIINEPTTSITAQALLDACILNAQRCIEARMTPIFTTVSPAADVTPGYDNATKKQIARDSVELVTEWCSNAGIACVNLYHMFAEPGTDGVLATAYDSGDGVHMNAAGCTLLAEEFDRILKTVKPK